MGLALALAAGLISWFAGNWSSAPKLQFYAAIATFVIIVLFALGMHIKIIKDINKLCDKFNKKIVKRGRPAKNSKKNAEILSIPLEKNIEEVVSVETCCELEEKS